MIKKNDEWHTIPASGIHPKVTIICFMTMEGKAEGENNWEREYKPDALSP